jgi:hypothetical protein
MYFVYTGPSFFLLKNHKYIPALQLCCTLEEGISMAVCGLGCSSVVQRLPSMREALGSIPAPKKKEKTKKKKKPQWQFA